MKRAARRIDPEVQRRKDMETLMLLPEFRRFLFFTVAQKSGIAQIANGDDSATFYNGRRSLGLEILIEADEALSVRDPANAPFAALALCTDEAHKLLTTEAITDENDNADYERR